MCHISFTTWITLQRQVSYSLLLSQFVVFGLERYRTAFLIYGAYPSNISHHDTREQVELHSWLIIRDILRLWSIIGSFVMEDGSIRLIRHSIGRQMTPGYIYEASRLPGWESAADFFSSFFGIRSMADVDVFSFWEADRVGSGFLQISPLRLK